MTTECESLIDVDRCLEAMEAINVKGHPRPKRAEVTAHVPSGD